MIFKFQMKLCFMGIQHLFQPKNLRVYNQKKNISNFMIADYIYINRNTSTFITFHFQHHITHTSFKTIKIKISYQFDGNKKSCCMCVYIYLTSWCIFSLEFLLSCHLPYSRIRWTTRIQTIFLPILHLNWHLCIKGSQVF